MHPRRASRKPASATLGVMRARSVGVLSLLLLVVGPACGTPAATAPAHDGGPLDDAWSGVDAAPGLDADPGLDGAAPDAAPGLDAGLDPFPSFASLLPGTGDATLFVGNSYTFVNDLPTAFRELASAAGQAPLRVESVTAGGYTLAMHDTDLHTDGTALATFLRTGTAADRAWDVVVLQEQSQIPGFPSGQPELLASLDAAADLAAAADPAPIVIYGTWGRERGDDLNPDLYPDFATMEGRLEAGFRAMAARIAADGHVVRIAPVGPAFARIHDGLVAEGADPLAADSPFVALYASDGSHPSPQGTYLAACVVFGTLTGTDPYLLAEAPSLGLDADTARRLRLVARATLADPAWTP